MDMMSYLMGRNSGGGGKGAKIEVVTELPETGEANVIYLVPKETEDENNVFDEYLYINDEWELIGSTAIDISGKQDTMQFSTMPNASADYLGKIVQYTGTTNANYTNGYFYIGITDGAAVPTYSWENINVQDGSELESYNKSVLYLWGLNISYSEDGSFTISGNQKEKLIKFLNDNIGNPVILVMGQNGVRTKIMYFFGNVSAYTQFPSIQYECTYLYIGENNTYYGYKQNSLRYDTTTGKISNLTSGNNIFYKKLMSFTENYSLVGLSAYSTSTTYQEGDYVYRSATDLTIYKCNTADTTGTWDSSKWDEKTYMEYLSDKLVGGALNGSY